MRCMVMDAVSFLHLSCFHCKVPVFWCASCCFVEFKGLVAVRPSAKAINVRQPRQIATRVLEARTVRCAFWDCRLRVVFPSAKQIPGTALRRSRRSSETTFQFSLHLVNLKSLSNRQSLRCNAQWEPEAIAGAFVGNSPISEHRFVVFL